MAPTSGKLPTWYRVLATIVGLMCIVSALIVLADPVLAVWLLVLLLALGLLFIGMDRVIIGISGQPLWSVVPMPPGSGSPPMGSGTGPGMPPKP